MIVYGMALVLSNHSVQLEVDGGEKKGEEDTASGFASIPSFMVLYPTCVVQSWGRELASPATGAVIRQCTLIDPASLYMQLYSQRIKFNCIQ